MERMSTPGVMADAVINRNVEELTQEFNEIQAKSEKDIAEVCKLIVHEQEKE